MNLGAAAPPFNSSRRLCADLAARSVQVAAALGGFITRVLADVASGCFESNAPQRAQQLRTVLSGLGPSFVKTGQALSGEQCDAGLCACVRGSGRRSSFAGRP